MHCCRICHQLDVAASKASSPPPKPIQDSVEEEEKKTFIAENAVATAAMFDLCPLLLMLGRRSLKPPILSLFLHSYPFWKKKSVNHLSSALIYRSASLMDAWQTPLREKEKKEQIIFLQIFTIVIKRDRRIALLYATFFIRNRFLNQKHCSFESSIW